MFTFNSRRTETEENIRQSATLRISRNHSAAGNEPLHGTPAIGQLPEFFARHRLHGIPLAGVEALVKRRAVLVTADELHRLARRGIEPDDPYVIT